jgi:hypothetical protein
MLHCSNQEVVMPRNEMPQFTTHNGDSSFVSLLSGWVQQGVENIFATQRILVDLVMSQNTNIVNAIRGRFADPEFCPAAVASELAGEAITNFIEGQKLLLGLLQREHDIVTQGVKERVAANTTAAAMTELAERGFKTVLTMQNEFLKMAGKQAHDWLASVKSGKPFDPENLVEMAREAVETFVTTQKKFLDIVAEQTSKATSGRESTKKTKKTDVAELAREATDAFIDAQKKLIDVAGHQVNAGMKAAGRAANMIAPFPFVPLPEFTREGVKNFVTAEKEILDTVMHRTESKHTTKPAHRARKRPGRTIKVQTMHATA